VEVSYPQRTVGIRNCLKTQLAKENSRQDRTGQITVSKNREGTGLYRTVENLCLEQGVQPPNPTQFTVSYRIIIFPILSWRTIHHQGFFTTKSRPPTVAAFSGTRCSERFLLATQNGHGDKADFTEVWVCTLNLFSNYWLLPSGKHPKSY
jgi:hypothetical protein